MVPDQGIDFQAYLESICLDFTSRNRPNFYRKGQIFYTPTDALYRERTEDWALGLMAQTIQPRKPEGQAQETERIERLNVLEGLRKYAGNHVLLKGRPGSGKSTALKRLLWEEANKCREGEKLIKIPVLLELREYSTSILELIQNFLSRHELELDEARIKTLLLKGQFLLLIDGVNELPNEDARRNLNTFRRNHPRTSMIFTTRDLGVDLGIEKKLEMQPLSEEQMQQFVCAYLPEVGEEMLRQLGGRLRELGETPLLLSMLCAVFTSTRQIPTSLGSIFRWFSREYDKLKADVPISEGLRNWQFDILQHLAFVMMQGETATELRLTISRQQARNVITEFLQGKIAHADDCARRWLEDLLKYHLIQLRTDDQIEFRHQLLQEYYAAENLWQRLRHSHISDEKLKRDYLNYLKWTEPIALMLALVDDEEQALRVVNLALDVDLQLGARLGGEVKREYQKKTVQLIQELDIHQLLKIQFFGITHSEEAVHFLRDSLQDKNSDICRSAASALEKIGNQAAVCALISALQHDNSHVRQISASSLGRIGNKVAITALIEALQDEDYHVRQISASSLGKIGNQAAVLALIASLHNEHNKHFYFINSAVNALGEIGNETATSALISALRSKNIFVSGNAASALELIGNQAATDALIEALQDEDSHVRGSAVSSLGRISNKAAVSALISALQHKDSYVRRIAASSLGKIGNKAVVSALISALQDEDSDVRESAASSLGEIGNEVAIDALIEALRDTNSDMRRIAASALEKIGNEAATDALIEALRDTNSDMRRIPASALGQIGNEAATDALISALHDEDYQVRGSAASALGKISNELAVSHLIRALYDEYYYVSRSAASALGKIGNEAATSPLIGALKYGDYRVCESVLAALGQIGNELAVSALIGALQDEDYYVRMMAASAFGEIGNKSVVSALIIALQDEDSHVSTSASDALKTIGNQAAVNALINALQYSDSHVSTSAANALGEIAGAEALYHVWALQLKNPSTYNSNVISEIQKRCEFYNHQIFNSPLPDENNHSARLLTTLSIQEYKKIMSENPKVQINFNAPITGSSVAGNVEGDSIGTQNNYRAAESIAEIETVIQKLLEQIEQNKPTPVEAELMVNQAVDNHPVLRDKQAIEQAVENNKNLRIRLRRVVTAVGIETVKIIFAPAGILIEGVKAWTESK
ncbi:MAG: HEAT repeat domain-containing protein [Nodularia sp. (in: cyanobacteria)]|nr:HEAT repeat domain-containing protein [Nodularia sp. (in: cyanobacteria)]